jgi:hypothetical protein
MSTRRHRSRKNSNRNRNLTKAPPKPGNPVCAPSSAASTRRKSNHSCLPKTILNTLKKTLKGSTGCKTTNQRCLIEKSNLPNSKKKELLATYFRPVMPSEWIKKPNTWLNSDDIAMVMKQYEAAYPTFRFIGVVPIDFSSADPSFLPSGQKRCRNQEFCTINLAEEKAAGRTLLGAIFNLDPHDKPGSHWVALAIDLRKSRIYYFDSVGMKPTKQVEHYMKYFTLQDSSLRLQSCGRKFQYGNTECGMYSMYFLIRMIDQVPFEIFCRNPISDKWMLKFRKILFDPNV